MVPLLIGNEHKVMKYFLLQRNSGFTLVEMLLTIALFSFVVGGVVMLPPLFRASFNKQQVVLDVTSDGDWAMDRMLLDIRTAQQIQRPNFQSTGTTLVLTSSSGNLVKYYVDTDNLMRCEGSTCVYFANRKKVAMTNFSITDFSASQTERVITVSFTLDHRYNSLGRAEYNFSKDFYGTAMKRN